MKITEVLNAGLTVSCELFPPKPETPFENVKKLVHEIALLKPSFMSVTYGAGGGNSSNTVQIADEIQNGNRVTALAHLSCVTAGRDQIHRVLDELKARRIENILALRGDLPAEGVFPAAGGYRYASELVEDIRSYGDFCVGGACYPEGHPESASLRQDIDNLKRKVDSGCQFLTTQMFFDNHILYNFLFRLMQSGVHVPVIAGIMPVTNGRQIARICKLSGTELPPRFRAVVERFGDKPAAMNQAGVAYATEQIIDLIANGVNHIHIYTMNKPDIAGRIMGNLSEIFR